MAALEIDQHSLLPGTVKFYNQHLILCTGTSLWPARVEESPGLFSELQAALHKAELPGKVRLTACAGQTGTDGLHAFLYPQGLFLEELTIADIPEVLRLLRGEMNVNLRSRPILSKQIFICNHKARDVRCGACGPPLIVAAQKYIEKHGYADRIEVFSSSHLGGHRFAGVIVAYPSGNWYGRITPENLPRLLDEELKGNRYSANWRGCINLTPDEQIAQSSGQN